MFLPIPFQLAAALLSALTVFQPRRALTKLVSVSSPRALSVFFLFNALAASVGLASGDNPRHDAVARWTFASTGVVDSPNALEPVGEVEFVELNGAERAASVARGRTGWVARLQGGHLDGGRHLNLTGAVATVYLRVRAEHGAWEGGLFNKRGSHEITNFNLFAANGHIGGEFHGEAAALGSVSFPAEGAMGTGWHDLVLRYDGQTIDIFCDGAPMAAAAWTGGSLTQNDEPLLIGAESVNGSPVRPFRGDVEEAALWSRALNNDEIAALSRARCSFSTCQRLPASGSCESCWRAWPHGVSSGMDNFAGCTSGSGSVMVPHDA